MFAFLIVFQIFSQMTFASESSKEIHFAQANVQTAGCFGDPVHFLSTLTFSRPNFLKPTLSSSTFDRIFAVLKEFTPAPVEFEIDRRAMSFDAFAELREGRRVVRLNAGLLLGREIDEDVVALVACHELGHHFGGEPAFENPPFAFEGQADFYSTQECFPFWVSRSESPARVPGQAVEYCRTALGRTDVLCARTLGASLKLTRVVAARKRLPVTELAAFDANVASATLIEHPAPQCRLDTFKSGFITRAIDGAQVESNRPACWFAPPTIAKI